MKKSDERNASLRARRQRIDIEFLFIDRTVCERCIGTERHLDEALSELSEDLKTMGVEVSVRKILVETEAMALALGFSSSPTIRINGKDIALEFRETRCESCESCAGSGPIRCRIWVYQGREYTEAPKAMLVEAIRKAAYGRTVSREPAARPRKLQSLPEDLRQFFRRRGADSAPAPSSCCPPSEQNDCCPPDEKPACCAASDAESCGCR